VLPGSGNDLYRMHQRTDPRSGEQIMLWHTSIAPQRLMPRGEVAMTCVGRPGYPASREKNQDLGRWRS
jgi:hypothetical protein